MKGDAVDGCKAKCEELGSCCHDTKSRCIDNMIEVDKNKCKKMAKFLKCLMVCECLCSYICTCCCEMEEVSEPCLKELCGKCDKLISCCKDLKSCLAEYECRYLNCDKLMTCCTACKRYCSKRYGSKSSKKSKKK